MKKTPAAPASTPAAIRMPRIGASLAGGIFAGIVRGTDTDQALVLMPEAPTKLTWPEAMKWAESQGASLPTRDEQAVLFGNLKDQFPNGGWYWSCEQRAGGESSAWCQYFSYGCQTSNRKVLQLRARAVRRLPLE